MQEIKKSLFTTISHDTNKTLPSDGLTEEIEPVMMRKIEFEYQEKY